MFDTAFATPAARTFMLAPFTVAELVMTRCRVIRSAEREPARGPDWQRKTRWHVPT
jgi:hypothetical protein